MNPPVQIPPSGAKGRLKYARRLVLTWRRKNRRSCPIGPRQCGKRWGRLTLTVFNPSTTVISSIAGSDFDGTTSLKFTWTFNPLQTQKMRSFEAVCFPVERAALKSSPKTENAISSHEMSSLGWFSSLTHDPPISMIRSSLRLSEPT